MLAQVIQTTVNATFLLLAAILIYDRWDNTNNTSSVMAAKKEMQEVLTAKANIDRLLQTEPPAKENEKVQEQR